MSIKVTVENPIDAIVKLKARKTLDGNILIFEHPEIDIVLSPRDSKVLALSKDQFGDHVYAAQSRMMEYLSRHGVINPSTVRGGNIFGSLEGVILESYKPEKVDPIQMTIYTIAHFLLEEKPFYNTVKDYEEKIEKELLEPDPSTELGDVPHEPKKGTVRQYPGINATYGMFGMYE